MKFRVKHDFDKFRPHVWTRADKDLFGERNEGFIIEGANAKEAFDAWNKQWLVMGAPGKQLNPFYLTITAEQS